MAALLLGLAACGSSSEKHHTITANGGAASSAAGGDGGQIATIGYGGPVTIDSSGGLPALPSLPSWNDVVPELGDNPLTITSDAALTVGDTFLGDDGTTAATGLEVARGATLTLTPESGSTVYLALANDLLVKGTLSLAKVSGSLDSTSLEVEAANVWVSGDILAQGGAAAAGANGGGGGFVNVYANGDLFVTGSVCTTGGAGDTGGAGGAAVLTVTGPAYTADVTPAVLAVTGLLDASGGAGTAGTGGAAGSAYAVSSSMMGGGSATAVDGYIAGELRARGGDGTAGGGNGGEAVAFASYGWLVSTGTLDGSGGTATVSGDGGAAYGAEVGTIAGKAYVGGALRASGGASPAGAGGDGGQLYVVSRSQTSSGPTLGITSSGPTLGIYVAADLDVSGGAGLSGGSAGLVQVYSQDVPSAGVVLSGYEAISATGGAGVTSGGVGGTFGVASRGLYDSTLGGNVAYPVTNQAAIAVGGGAASGGAGGAGGSVALLNQVEDSSYPLVTPGKVLSAGAIDARGGTGTTAGGAGGVAQLHDVAVLQLKGAVDLSGGAGGTGDGGPGGYVMASSDTASGTVTISGRVTASGGASTSANGGVAGSLQATAAAVTCGAVTADGGAAGATGGNGGGVSLTGSASPSTLTGTISLRAGTGATAGTVGTLTVDGSALTLTDSQYKP